MYFAQSVQTQVPPGLVQSTILSIFLLFLHVFELLARISSASGLLGALSSHYLLTMVELEFKASDSFGHGTVGRP